MSSAGTDKVDVLKTPLGLALIAKIKDAYSKGPERHVEHGFGQAIYNSKLNAYLLNASLDSGVIPIDIGPEYLAYDVDDPRDRSILSFIKSEKARLGTKLFNSKKIRLSSSVPTNSGSAVYLRQTDYFSSLFSDQFAFQSIERGEEILRDGYSDFLDDKTGCLRSFETAERMSNQIGASTLAFSQDGLLLLVRQTKGNSQSEGLLAPSGSGSLDWEDVEGQHDFLSIIAGGAARELVEECGLEKKLDDKDDVIDPALIAKEYLRIYGFARMLHRGGKPEFFCVSVLPFSAYRIDKARLSKHEELYTQRTVLSGVPNLDFSDHPLGIREQILNICARFLDVKEPSTIRTSKELNYLSFPLSHGLYQLREALKGSRGLDLVEFLKSAARRG